MPHVNERDGRIDKKIERALVHAVLDPGGAKFVTVNQFPEEYEFCIRRSIKKHGAPVACSGREFLWAPKRKLIEEIWDSIPLAQDLLGLIISKACREHPNEVQKWDEMTEKERADATIWLKDLYRWALETVVCASPKERKKLRNMIDKTNA